MKCVICGSKVGRDGSFSNQGENVHCVHCVERLFSRLRCSVSDYLKKYVWPYRDKDVSKLRNLLAIDLAKADRTKDSWCDTRASTLAFRQPGVERYKCHSRTRGVPIDGQGYVYGYWSRFENGMIVRPQAPVDFSGETGGLVVVQRYYTDECGVECLEDGRVVIPLDTFRKCFSKVER